MWSTQEQELIEYVAWEICRAYVTKKRRFRTLAVFKFGTTPTEKVQQRFVNVRLAIPLQMVVS